jgi:hypothetical protein
MTTVVCYAHGKPGDWEGVCIDFDLAVQGRSFAEVQKLLEVAVTEYVAAAMEEAPDVRDRLLSRRAPLSVSLNWTLRVLLSSLRHRRDDDDNSASFPVACAA